MQVHLKRWVEEPTLINAAEVLDCAIMCGNNVAAVPAAISIVKNDHAEPSLKAAANQVLGKTADRPVPLLNSTDEWRDEAIQKAISKLKQRLENSPRDGLTALEIARLQSQKGQYKSAQRYVERALASAPNDRYVLRSAARFFDHKSVKGDAALSLRAILSSDAVRTDPWVQAAEIAIANICGTSSKFALKARDQLITNNSQGIEFSELASGIAGLEFENGSGKRRIKKLLDISLTNPTENALAQAMWFSREIGTTIDVSMHLKAIPNAYEARARTSFDAGDYRAAVTEGWNWLGDQHLSPNAATFGTFTSSVLLSDYKRALQFAERGLMANPGLPTLINSKIVALALDGRISEAVTFLPKLEAFEHDPNSRPFIFAARGLISFRQGNVALGRTMYGQAIEAAKHSSRRTLAGNAAMFWLEQELMAGTIHPEDASKFLVKIDEAYATRPYGSGKALSWIARRKNIVGLLKSLNMRHAILQRFSSSNVASQRVVESVPQILID